MSADATAGSQIASTTRWGVTVRYRLSVGGVSACCYIGTIAVANYAIHHVGTPPPPGVHGPHVVPVGFGLVAPSGVYFVALALVLRNVLQRQLGRGVAAGAILIGAAISWFVADPGLAEASAAAFLLSELLDMTIYTRLRRYGQYRAVLPASLAGAALDSAVFLWIAFGSEAFWSGQMLGKTWGVLVAALFLLMAELLSGVENSPWEFA